MNKSTTCLTIYRERILQADNRHTNESRQRGEEKEVGSTKAKAPCVEGVSQETQEVDKNSKVDDKQKENISEADVFEDDKADSTKDTAVSASTQAPGVGDVSQHTQEAERKSK
jgi:hypothetical protein